MDRHFLQLVSTDMGTKVTPPYANLFMARYKETIWEAFIRAIPFWKIFIDDIFLIFLDTTKQLQSMKDFVIMLYRKPTDCAALLYFHSNHSFKCKERIVFSQSLR